MCGILGTVIHSGADDLRGVLRRHVRLFLGSEAVPLDAPLEPGAELRIVAAISGG